MSADLSEEIEQLRAANDQLKMELEYQINCTSSLLESQDRLAVELEALQKSLAASQELVSGIGTSSVSLDDYQKVVKERDELRETLKATYRN